jgi:hypothetical protein
MIKFKSFFILGLSTIIASCSGCSTAEQPGMQSGFYFVAKEQDGVEMKIERLNEVYTISRTPFASVKNISYSEIKKTNLKDGIYAELRMTFDPKGSKDIENATGNVEQPKLAVVVDNKLLYVVDNTTKITTGVMCVGLISNSEDKINAMKHVVDQKR